MFSAKDTLAAGPFSLRAGDDAQDCFAGVEETRQRSTLSCQAGSGVAANGTEETEGGKCLGSCLEWLLVAMLEAPNR